MDMAVKAICDCDVIAFQYAHRGTYDTIEPFPMQHLALIAVL